jgi:hypothetical protein
MNAILVHGLASEIVGITSNLQAIDAHKDRDISWVIGVRVPVECKSRELLALEASVRLPDELMHKRQLDLGRQLLAALKIFQKVKRKYDIKFNIDIEWVATQTF